MNIGDELNRRFFESILRELARQEIRSYDVLHSTQSAFSDRLINEYSEFIKMFDDPAGFGFRYADIIFSDEYSRYAAKIFLGPSKYPVSDFKEVTQ